jgi:hypothetical protein
MAIVFNIDKNAMANIKKYLNGEVMVKIGVLNNSAREGGFGAVELAMVQEFGSQSKGIPARSFLRKTMKNRESEFVKEMDSNRKSIEKGISEGKLSEFLGKVGAKWVAYVIDTFEAQGPGWKPLSLATLAARRARKKGKNKAIGTKALIDTGAMLRSITYEVIDK